MTWRKLSDAFTISAMPSSGGLPAERLVLLLASAWFLLAMYCTSRRRTTEAILAVAVISVSWNDFRLPGGLTFSDPLLISAAILAGMESKVRWRTAVRDRGALRSLARFGVVLLVGGLIGGTVASSRDPGFLSAGRLAISLAAVLYLAAALVSDEAYWYLVARAYVLGTAISGLVAITSDTSAGFRGRATGLANHPNHFGLTMMLGIFCAICLAVRSIRLDRYLGLTAFLPLGAGLLASGSRAALASTILGLGFLLVSQGSRALPKTILLALAGIPLVGWIAGNASSGTSALSRLIAPTKYEDVASQDRLGHYADAARLIRDFPLTGVGFSRGLVFHNLPLQILVTAGLLGAIALCFFAAYLYQVISYGIGGEVDRLWRTMAGGVLGTASFLLVSPNLYDRFLLLFLVIAACTPFARSEVGPVTSRSHRLGIPLH